MLRLGLISFLCFVCSLSFGVTLSKAWDRFVGGTAGTASFCADAVTTGDGAMYVLAGFDDGSANGVDVRVTKYSRIGTVLWTYTLPDLADLDDDPERILSAESGDIVFTAIRHTGPRSKELVVSRLDRTTGAPKWTKQYPDFEDAKGAVLVPGNGFVVGGSQKGAFGVTDAVVILLDSAGTQWGIDRWNRYRTAPAFLRDITYYSGNVYAALGTGTPGNEESALGAWNSGLLAFRWSRFLDLRPLRPVSVAVNTEGHPMLAAVSTSGDNPQAVVSKFSSDGYPLWDSVYTYAGSSESPVGLYTIADTYQLISTSASGDGTQATVARWNRSSYPTILAAFDDGASTEAEAFFRSNQGPVIAGDRTPAAGGRQWYTTRFSFAGARDLNFVEGGGFEVARVKPAFRGYLVVGQDVAGNQAKVGRATLLSLGIPPASVTLSPSVVTGGSKATATVTLPEEAPIGGVQLPVQSTNPNAKVPATVTIPAGKTTGTFTVETLPVSVSAEAFISVGKGAEAKEAQLTILKPEVSGLIFTSELGPKYYGGEPLKLKIQLSGPAPAGGAVVQFVGGVKFGLPLSTGIPAGASSKEISGMAPVSATKQEFSMTARTTKPFTGKLTVEAPILTNVVTPQYVRGGDTFPVSVTMRGKSPTNLTLQYTPATPLTLAKTFTVAANALTASTQISSKKLGVQYASAKGSVKYLGSSKEASVILLQLGMAKLTITPNSGKAGATVVHRIELDQAATVIGKIGVSGAGWSYTVNFAPGMKVVQSSQKVKALAPKAYDITLVQGIPIAKTPFTILP